jgi:hypothetical protein
MYAFLNILDVKITDRFDEKTTRLMAMDEVPDDEFISYVEELIFLLYSDRDNEFLSIKKFKNQLDTRSDIYIKRQIEKSLEKDFSD